MNTSVIILGVLLILVIVFMIFRSYFSGETALKNQVSFKNQQPNIPHTQLSNSNSPYVTYTIWVFVNSWDTTREKLIFRRDNDVSLYLDSDEAKLVAFVGEDLSSVQDGDYKNFSSDTTTMNKITITNNFPVQKWVCILVSVDNNIVDIYLDGKLVKSVQTSGFLIGHETSPIIFGAGWDGYFAKFERKPKATDPKAAWDKYMEGNGGSTLANAFGNYGMSLNILKDNSVTSNFVLF